MTEPRKSQHHQKARQRTGFGGRAGSERGAGAGVPAGRTPYRDEFELDHGPDLDEALDETESGHEF